MERLVRSIGVMITRRLYGRRPGAAAAIRAWLFPPGRSAPRIARLPDGLRLEVDAAERTGGDLFFGLPFEPLEARLVGALLREGATFVDIGANVGRYTFLASRLVGPSGQVHAFEPASTTYQRLERTLAMTGATNVVLNRLALSDAPGEARLYLNRDSALAGLGMTGRGEAAGTERVRCTTLDSYAAEKGLAHVDLIKIDVEGFEGHVLRGAEGVLARSPGVVVLSELAEKNFVPLRLRTEEVIGRMRTLGFAVWRIDAQNAAFARSGSAASQELASRLRPWS